MLADLHSAVRILRRRPAFSAAIVITLALGLAVSAALFAVVDGLLLKRMPFRSPDELFVVGPTSLYQPGRPSTIAWRQVEEVARLPGVHDAAGYCEGPGFFDVNVQEAESVRATSVTARFFETFGIAPPLGRPLSAGDATVSDPPNILIGDGLWRSRFGGDRSILDRPLRLGGRLVVVVGIMPPLFDFPRGTNVWVSDPGNRSGARYLFAVARIPSRASATVVVPGFTEPFVAQPLGKFLRPLNAPSVVVLFLATAVALLITWVHLGALQIAQAVDRSREFAVRMAVGAGQGRLIRQCSFEAVALTGLAVMGAFCALPPTLAVILRLLPVPLTLGQPIGADYRTAGFLGALTILGSIALTVGPFMVIRQTRLPDVLRGRTPVFGSIRASRGRWVLLGTQVALVAILLYGAALATQTYVRAARTDLGFDHRDLLSVPISIAASEGTAQARFAQLLERLRQLPFVTSAAAGGIPLLAGKMPAFVGSTAPGTFADMKIRNALQFPVSPGYFRTLRTPLRCGSDQHTDRRLDEVLLSEALVKSIGLQRPCRGEVVYVNGARARVAGVVADVRGDGPEEPPTLYVYVPGGIARSGIVVRTAIPAADAVAPILQVVRNLTGERGPISVEIGSVLFERVTAGPRSRSALLGILALSSLALGVLGISGATAETVRRRLRDTAVRVALGADPAAVAHRLVGQATSIVGIGAGVGVLVGRAAGRWASSLVYGIDSADRGVMIGVMLLLPAWAVVAAWGPARRLAKVDPLAVLREE